MNNIIKINNLCFKYQNKGIFNNLNLIIKKNSFINIVGINGTGKTTLAKILSGKIKTKLHLRKTILLTIKKGYAPIKVLDYIKNNVKKCNIETLKEIEEKIGIKILNKKVNKLNKDEQYVKELMLAIIKNPNILIIDTDINEINGFLKKNIISYLKDNRNTVIYLTDNLEDSLYSDYIYIINNKKAELFGETLEILKEEKKLKKIGLDLPFMIDLSNKLKLYNLIDKTITNMNEMVDTLWK